MKMYVKDFRLPYFSIFVVLNHEFFICINRTRITASNIATGDITIWSQIEYFIQTYNIPLLIL